MTVVNHVNCLLVISAFSRLVLLLAIRWRGLFLKYPSISNQRKNG